jgi:hypothetical protein
LTFIASASPRKRRPGDLELHRQILAGASPDPHNGRIELDNNAVERTIRPIALNRKNALLASHDAGAESWAVIASLFQTCKFNAFDPYAWLAATLRVIVADHKQSRINDLLP